MFRIFKKIKQKIVDWCLSSQSITAQEFHKLNNPKRCHIDDLNGELKFIERANIENYYVKTHKGYSKIKYSLKTVPYIIYKVRTENGFWLECADTHILIDEDFNEVYCKDLKIGDKLITLDGISPIVSILETGEEDSMYDLELDDNEHLFFTNGILSHNTITISMYLLWLGMFKEDQEILIASKNNKHSIEIMDRIKYAYEELPHWLKPGVKVYNRHSIHFDNRSKIESEATTEKTGRGLSLSKLYIDELAFVKPNIQEEMWTSLAPTLSEGGGSIISSTPNGDTELFAQLWRQANSALAEITDEEVVKSNLEVIATTKKTENDEEDNDDNLDIIFYPVEIAWTRHPTRGEKFKKRMIGKIGELKWKQEYENEFLSSEALLVDSRVLFRLNHKEPVRTVKEFKFWKEQYGGFNKTYLVGVDIASGNGNDFSVIQVLEFPSLEQVIEWRSNVLKPEILYLRVKGILNYLTKQDQNGKRSEVMWTFERNGIGHSIASLYSQDEHPPEYADLYSDKGGYGYHLSGKIKMMMAVQLKSLIEKIRNGLTLNSKQTIFELKNYIAKGGSYEAKQGATDDTISGLLLCMILLKKFSEYDEEAFQNLFSLNERDYVDETDGYEDMENLDAPMGIY